MMAVRGCLGVLVGGCLVAVCLADGVVGVVLQCSIRCRHLLFDGGALRDSGRASSVCVSGCLLLCDCMCGRWGYG